MPEAIAIDDYHRLSIHSFVGLAGIIAKEREAASEERVGKLKSLLAEKVSLISCKPAKGKRGCRTPLLSGQVRASPQKVPRGAR